MYTGAAFPASHRRDGEMENKPPSHRKSLENTAGFDLRTMTSNDLQRIKSYYYGMISLNDKYIGRMLESLDSLGLTDRTVVVVTADHGEMLGDHGLLFKAGYMYDEVLRTPLIFRAPGKLPAGRRIAAMTEGIDIMPTLLELLGLRRSERVQGRSLLPVINGKDSGRQEVHSEFPTTKMIRTEEWKLVHYVRAPYGELYNLREDPHELHNLYDDPAHAKVKAEMKSRLADWLVESQDPALPPVPAQRA
jgi:arylsulfatase A-like enzyme